MKKFFQIIWIGILCLALTSCGGRALRTEELLGELTSLCEELPEGQIYKKGGEDGTALSERLLGVMYGEEAVRIMETVEEYAIYLSSFAKPCEIAVFRCYSATDAHGVSALCMNRWETIRVALRGSGYEELSDEAVLIQKGRYVVFAMTDRSEELRNEILRWL